MPLPPPPAAALTSSGRPSAFVASRASLDPEDTDSRAGKTGAPALAASFRARTLSPEASSVSALGPMNVTSALAQARAKAGFSDKKP